MTRLRSRYASLGLALVLGGGAFAAVGWLVIAYTPLVALGAAAVILGLVSLGLGRSLPTVSPEAGQVFLQAGLDNVAALLEELGVTTQALYLPSSRTGAVGWALIPVQGNSPPAILPGRLERRLLVHFGGEAQDFGVLVATPGVAAISLNGLPRTASLDQLEETLKSLLVGRLDLAAGVTVNGSGYTLRVEHRDPTLAWRPHPAHAVLGSPLASLSAAVVAEALERPVSVLREAVHGRRHIVELHLHGPEKL